MWGNQFPYRNSRYNLQLRRKHRKLQNSIKQKIVFKIQAKIFLLTDRKLELRRQVSHSKITTQLLHNHNTITTVETSHISRKTFMVELKSHQEMIAEINYRQRSGDDQQQPTGKKKNEGMTVHPPSGSSKKRLHNTNAIMSILNMDHHTLRTSLIDPNMLQNEIYTCKFVLSS